MTRARTTVLVLIEAYGGQAIGGLSVCLGQL